MNILVTGGAGFIGSNHVRLLLEETTDRVVNLDLLTYAGNLENLAGVEDHPRYRFVRGDVRDGELLAGLLAEEEIDAVVHFAAESHVDRSIDAPGAFLDTNTRGTQVLLQALQAHQRARLVLVSTDEVYGSLAADAAGFTEQTPLAPNSPYAASKAAADLLARAYHHTFGLDVCITRCSNNYGPYQFPEKLIPLMLTNALADQPLPVYGDGQNVRDWLHVEDHCRAVDLVLRGGRAGEVYNVGGQNEWTNLDLVKLLLSQVGKPESLITFVKDRPGHDRRYAIVADKIRDELGWRPRHSFPEGLARTIAWYREHHQWWQDIRSGAYRDYYERMYGSGGRHGEDA
jgi:dTDP-glucose 4,6-dehydratase